MSLFAQKRKARVISIPDDLESDLPTVLGGEEGFKPDNPCVPEGPIKFGRNKPPKSSSLRKSLNLNDVDPTSDTIAGAGEDEDASGSVVKRPPLGRSGSTKQKKRQSTSRLSFGPGENDGESEEVSTRKKSLGQRALESNALRKTASLQNLQSRLLGGEREERSYDRDYLQELQNSTPNTPQNIAALHITDDDEMALDAAELDGALVVRSQDLARPAPSLAEPTTQILTEAEIRERKERRARLAQEADIINLDSDGDSGEEGDGPRSKVTWQLGGSKKDKGRLIAEDEDLGEGYDDFVLDGRLSLSRNAERDAKRQHRLEMAEMIRAAEDGSGEESDDSEAERRAAYEMAQRRAGMDGLSKPGAEDVDLEDGLNIIPRMKPLPELGEVMQRMRALVQGLEDDVTRKNARISGLEKEKAEILVREQEVQKILDQVAEKYQAVMGASAGASASAVADAIASGTPGKALPGLGADGPTERGLESFGTPIASRDEMEE